MSKATTLQYWSERARKALVGRKIVDARYLSKEEVDDLGWTQSVLVMQLDDGTLLYPSMDDEGNNGGAMFGNKGKEEAGFPVVRDYSREAPPPFVPMTAPVARLETRHYAALKRIRSGEKVLHARNGKTLREMEAMGVLTMQRIGPQWAVELTEKGKAA